MTQHDTRTIVATFAVYLAICLALGFVAWRRTTNLKDFILGGRSLGPWVTALSAQATDMSGWLLLGLPGFAYLAGVESAWLVGGLIVGTWLNWRFVAQPLRERTEALGDALTLPAYFERAFSDTLGLLRPLTAFFILVFFILYASSQFVAAGRLFESLFGLPYAWAVFWGSIVMLAYTFLGGFLAVSWSDVLQGTLMFFALVLVAAMGVHLVGGFDGLHATLNAFNAELLNPWTNVEGAPLGWIGITSSLAWGLGYCGQPHILARFMAIRDPQAMHVARRVAMTWQIVVLIAAMLVGMTALGALPVRLEGAEAEKVFIQMSAQFFPPWIAGICLAGVLAAIMSTASAQLLLSSAAFAEDFYRGLIRKQAGATELLWVGRLGVLGVAAVAFVLALDPGSTVLARVGDAWAGFGATFGPAIVLSLHWRRMTRASAYAGILVGGLTVVAWMALADRGGIFALYAMVPGFVASFLAILLVGSLKRRR
ncbi:MAG: sodium/proline symporter PutP [Rhodanobacteraceae bacterium]|nr:sodium/proline symporter PutP [Rhodanobacteraceae bacterium]MBL0042838.1 sodium/proline symporter PutP [Xanthomonadales bacterium]MBP6079552.1 sodium/proline symporter PutP [Xanthomonadales bacterium]